MSQTNPAHSASASALHIAKPPQGEHLVVQNTGNIRIECAFSAKEATLRQEGEDLIFTFSDGTSLTIAHYYATNAESSALPPLIMAGEAVQVPQLLSQEAAQQEAEQEAQSAREPGPQESPAAAEAAEAAQNTANTASKGKALPQNSGDAPSDSPTQQGQNAQNSSSTQASPSVLSSTSSQSATATATALDGGRFHNFDTNELLDGIHRLPGLDLPWGQKLHESKLDYSGLVEEDEIEADAGLLVEPAEPADPADPGESAPSVPEVVQTPPTLVVDAARLTAEEAGVRLQNSDPNADFAGTALITGKVQGTDAESTDLEYGFLHNGSLVQTLTTSYGSVTMAPDGSYSYSLNNDLPEINTMKEGQQAEDSFTVAVSDGQGGMDSQVITVEIHGTNDMPTLQLTDISFTAYGKQTVFSGQAVGGDGDKDASWTYGLEDGKENPLNAQEQFVVDDYGTLYIDTVTGVYRYELDSSKPAPAAGSTHECTVTVIVTDEHGAHTDQDLTVHLTGSGDYVDFKISGTATEAGVKDGGNLPEVGTSCTGQVDLKDTNFELGSVKFSFTDADGKPTTSIEGTYGTFTIDAATGKYTYTLNADAGGITDKLHSEETQSEATVTITITDAHGVSMDVPLDITVTGTNDKPVITEYQERLFVTEITKSSDSSDKAIQHSDIDDSDTYTYSIADTTSGAMEGKTTMQGKYGTLTLNDNGTYTYTLTSSPFHGSGENSKGEDVFTIVVTDQNGAYDTKPLVVEITGTESKPVFSTTDSYEIDVAESGVFLKGTEDSDGNKESDGIPSVTKKINVTDLDAGDEGHFNFVIVDSLGNILNDGKSYTSSYGTLVINENGTYTYTLNNDSVDVQKLVYNATITEKIYIKAIDPSGTSSEPRELHITISGNNDKPFIANTEFTNDSLKEDGTAVSGEIVVKGNVGAEDYDNDEVDLQYSLVGGGRTPQALEGTYGYLKLEVNGDYTYTLYNSKVQYLAEGEKGYEKFTIRVVDPLGAYSDTEVSFVITGTNDLPIVKNSTSTIFEDGKTVGDSGSPEVGDFSVNGNFTIENLDIDTADTQTFSLKDSSHCGVDDNGNALQIIHGKYGDLVFNTITGAYTYTLLENKTDDIQKLNIGDFQQETFTVQVTSGNGEISNVKEGNITITIEGTNDIPIVTNSASLDLEVNTGNEMHPMVSGDVEAFDIDADSHLEYYFDADKKLQNAQGTYGTLTIDDNGHYVYTLNIYDNEYTEFCKTDAKFVMENFKVTVIDEHGASVVVPIDVKINKVDYADGGAENPPKITAPQLTVIEDEKQVDDTGRFLKYPTPPSPDPPEADDSYFFAFKVGNSYVHSITDAYGTLSMDPATGHYTYTLNNDVDKVQFLSKGEEVIIGKLADGSYDPAYTVYWHQQSTGTNITVKIVGTNDAPKITATQEIVINEGIADDTGVPVFNGTLKGSCTVEDIDTTNAVSGKREFYFLDEDGESHTNTLTLTYGTVTINKTTGEYIYTITDTKLHHTLDMPGEQSFTVYVNDGSGAENAVAKGTVNIDFNGINYAPVINSTIALSATEDKSAGDVLSGKVEATDDTDITSPNSLIYKITAIDNVDCGKVNIAYGLYGTLTLKNDGTYEYLLNNAIDEVQHLQAGSTIKETFTISVTDHNGDTTTTPVIVTIKGTNDAPIISVTDAQLVVTEGDPKNNDGGVASRVDVDTADTATYSFEAKNAEGLELANYGTFIIDSTTGKYSFTLDNTLPDVQKMYEAQHITFKISITVTDSQGATDIKEIDLVLHGKNDAPVIIPLTDKPEVTEGTTTTCSGTITASDVDAPAPGIDGTATDCKFWLYNKDATDPINNLLTTEHGYITIDPKTGEYTYTLTDTDWLGENQTGTDSFWVVATDNFEGGISAPVEVKVTVNGAGESVTPPAPTPPAPTPASFSSPVETESLDALLPASVLGPEQGAAGSALAAEQGPGLDGELPAALEHASLADMQACLDAMPEVGLCSQGGGQGDAPEAYTPFIADDLPVDMPLSLSDKGEAQLAQEVAQRILAETGAI